MNPRLQEGRCLPYDVSTYIFFKWATRGLFFFIFVFATNSLEWISIQWNLLMTGFEPGSSDIRSDRAVNTAATTGLIFLIVCFSAMYLHVPTYLKLTWNFYRRRNQNTFAAKLSTWPIYPLIDRTLYMCQLASWS